MSQVVTDYWHRHYLGSNKECILCDGFGYIVTSNAYPPLNRAHYCICPNGQLLRKHNIPIPAPYV